jgi:hypothetical protein
MRFIPRQFPANIIRSSGNDLLADLKRLPLIIQLVLLFMVVIFVWNETLLGYNLSGLAWVIPFALALLVLARNLSMVTFPFFLWLPWVLLLIIHLFLVDGSQIDSRVIPLQRTMQLLSPLAVGMAVSTWRPTAVDLRAFLATCRRLACMLLLIVLLKTGVLLTGVLPAVTGLAAEAITVTLLCSLFATSYIITRSKNDLILWALLACVPVIAVTRTAIAAALLTFPLSLSAPLALSRRILGLALLALVGLAIFNSDRIQKKMFYSGQGTLEDISTSNQDFATTGRKRIWEKMVATAKDEEWTGHGTGMGETFVYRITRKAGYPHNDWLLTFYDYGYLGVAIYILCLIRAIRHGFFRARQEPDLEIRVLFSAGISAFVPFTMMMFTDNVMVYASYFGNLHFVILGLAYGAQRKRQKAVMVAEKRPVSRW